MDTDASGDMLHRDRSTSVRTVALFPLLRHFAEKPGFGTILEKYGISEGCIRDSYELIPLAVFFAILEDAAQLADDPALGARLGAGITPGDLGPAGILLAQSATLRRGLARYAQSISALQGGTEVRLNEIDGQLEFTYQVNIAGIGGWPQDAEMSLASTCNLIRTCFDRQWKPITVHFAHGPIEKSCGLQHIFRAPVKFWQNTNRLIFSAENADMAVRKEDKDLLELVTRHIDGLVLKEGGRRRDYVEVLRSIVVRRLGRSPCTLPDVATELGVTRRTLQRHLTGQGTTFREIIREQRQKIAALHLSESHRSMSEVAWTMGYSDATVFWRAYKRWTGEAPTCLRQAGKSSVSSS